MVGSTSKGCLLRRRCSSAPGLGRLQREHGASEAAAVPACSAPPLLPLTLACRPLVPPQIGGGRKATQARRQAAAEAVLATGGFDTSITNYARWGGC